MLSADIRNQTTYVQNNMTVEFVPFRNIKLNIINLTQRIQSLNHH